MKIFFDTKSTGLHKNTTLISIGLISENGQEFYAELSDYDENQTDEWLQSNIIDNLILFPPGQAPPNLSAVLQAGRYCGERVYIAEHLRTWLGQFDQVEMWSDVLAYDWVLFTQLFGYAQDIPENVYYIPFDIATLFKIEGIDPDIDRRVFAGLANHHGAMPHNALWDAKVIRACYKRLTA